MAFRATYRKTWIPETCLSTTSLCGAPVCPGMSRALYSLILSNDSLSQVKCLYISFKPIFKWLRRQYGPSLGHLYFNVVIKRCKLQERLSKGRMSRTVVEGITGLLWNGRSSLMLDLHRRCGRKLQEFRRPLFLGFSLPLTPWSVVYSFSHPQNEGEPKNWIIPNSQDQLTCPQTDERIKRRWDTHRGLLVAL